MRNANRLPVQLSGRNADFYQLGGLLRNEVEVMKAKNGAAARKAASVKSEYNAELVRRWREQAERRTAEVAALPGYDSARLVAAEEGKPLSELIVSILCRQRLRGKIVRHFRPEKCTALKGAALGQIYHAYLDTVYEERESTRRRDRHERELIENALSLVAYNRPDILDTLNARERRALLRRFYRTGDLTAQKAIDRAIRFAIGTSAG